MDKFDGGRGLMDWPPIIPLTQHGNEGGSDGTCYDSSLSQTRDPAKENKKQIAKREKNKKRRARQRARRPARIRGATTGNTATDDLDTIPTGGSSCAGPTKNTLRLPSRTLFCMRRNFKKQKEGMATHICPDFDVEETIRNTRKTQPPGNKDPGFEIANEPTLELIEGEILTLSDKNGVPCVIKAGGRKTTFLNAQLIRAIEEYASSRVVSNDPVRHGQMGSRTRCQRSDPGITDQSSNRLTGQSNEGQGAGTSAARGCTRLHRRFAARMDYKTHNIQLGQGPAETYRTKNDIQALREFATKLSPLTKVVEAIYSVFLPDDFAKYKKVFDFLYGNEPDVLDSAFGVWTSRSIVLDALTNIHRDLEDVCRGWCALVPCGDFQGGDACFPSLGVKLQIPVGTVVFLRSYALEHYIGAYTGTRYCVVHFTHQSVHDYYAQETKQLLWECDQMPIWWGKSREALVRGTVLGPRGAG